jgi:hypothetical protein
VSDPEKQQIHIEEIRAWLGRVIRDLPDHALPELVFAVKDLQAHYVPHVEREAPPKGPIN